MTSISGHASLIDGQQVVVRTILGSRDRIVGVQGYAESGKTIMLVTMREVAGRHKLVALTPSTLAARTFEGESDIKSHTLQHFLAKYGAIAKGRHRSQNHRPGQSRHERRNHYR